jgi:hypothetical protein
MDSEHLRQQIRDNAQEIVRLHSRIHETYLQRSESPDKRGEWEKACAEFHTRYDRLAFPTGYQGGGALRRIEYGDPEAMEAAVCFLEVRPYFFRSGYMFKDILRKCRKAPLSADQAARLNVVEKKYLDWRERKQSKRKP